MSAERIAVVRRRAAGAILVAAGIGGLSLAVSPAGVAAAVETLARSLHGAGPAGAGAFAALQIVLTLSGVVPVSLLGMAAGALYGPALGFAVAASGCIGAAAVAFWLSRSALGSFVARRLAHDGRLRGIDGAVARGGWRAVCLLRLTPLPFAAASYLLGLTSVGFRAYLVGTLVCLPVVFGFVAVGALAGASLAAGVRDAEPLRWIVLGLGAGAVLALAVYAVRLASARSGSALRRLRSGAGTG